MEQSKGCKTIPLVDQDGHPTGATVTFCHRIMALNIHATDGERKAAQRRIAQAVRERRREQSKDTE